jgi:hypothetical protein
MVKKSAPIPVEVIDGRTIASSTITHETTPLELRIGKHAEKIDFNIISTPHHLIILGLPWWKRTTLSSIVNPEPSLSAHNDARFKNPKPRKTPCQVLPRTLWSRTQRGSEPILIMSSPAVKSPLVAKTKPCPIKNLVKNPTKKTNLVRIFFVGAKPFLLGCQ